MGWIGDHPRLFALLLSIVAAGALILFGQYAAAILCAYYAAGVIYYSIREPESEIAIQQDDRDQELEHLGREFVQCLIRGGITPQKDEPFECVEAEPVRFVYYPMTYGTTLKKLEQIAEQSQATFKAIRYAIEQLPQNKEGYFGYSIAFFAESEIDELARTEVFYKDIEHEQPTYKKIPVGIFTDKNGDKPSIAYVSFDGANMLLGALPRCGKSCLLQTIACGLARCPAERIILCSSKCLDFQFLSPRVELYQKPQEILNALKQVNEIAEKRKEYCVQNGLKQVTDFSISMPHLIVIFDEYGTVRGSLVEDPDGKKPRKIGEEIERELIKTVSQNAFAGIQVVLASQRLSSTVISTDLRDLIGGNLVSFANGSAASDTMIFDTRADEARASEIPVTAKGVGYIYTEGVMDKPKLFKAALVDEETQKRIAEETKHLIPTGEN